MHILCIFYAFLSLGLKNERKKIVMKKEIHCQCLIEKISYLAFMDPFHLGLFKSEVQEGEKSPLFQKQSRHTLRAASHRLWRPLSHDIPSIFPSLRSKINNPISSFHNTNMMLNNNDGIT